MSQVSAPPSWWPAEVPAAFYDTSLRVVQALAIFIGGWFIARLISGLVYGGLRKTTVDDKIAEKLHLHEVLLANKKENALERFISRVVCWLLLLGVLLSVLSFAELEAAGAPIQSLLSEITGALPHVGKAALILFVAWLAATVLRKLVIAAMSRADSALVRYTTDEADAESSPTKPRSFSDSAGQLVYWVLMSFGLAGAFDALNIEVISQPLQNAIDTGIGMLPNVLMAGLLLLAGWILGHVARTVVSNATRAIGVESVVERLGIQSVFGKKGASGSLGWVAMSFVVLQFVISALDRVGLASLSEPLTDMMARFWLLLPSVLVSAAFIAAGIVFGRLAGELVATLTERVGVDNLAAKLGLESLTRREDGRDRPSVVLGQLARAAIIILAVSQALTNLQLEAWAGYVDAFLTFAVERVLVALLIVIVGLLLANYVRDLLRAREAQVSGLAEFGRQAVVVFAFTMALEQLGLAEDFVLLAFGLLFGAICLAFGLAFGLGGREVAGSMLSKKYASLADDAAKNPSADAAPGASDSDG